MLRELPGGVTTRDILRAGGLSQRDRPDLLIGGPPCVAFSKSGFWLDWKRDGIDPAASLLQACKNALRETYADGEAKVEAQKTRDSGTGRKYTFEAFDILAACLFSVTGHWEFRFKRSSDLIPWTKDPTRIGAMQRIDATWSTSLADVIETL